MARARATTHLSYTPDWPGQAVDRLLHAWDKPRIRALTAALGAGVQMQEDLQWDLLTSTTLDAATGDALDQWGDLVGEQRGALADQSYRQFLQARMLANRCPGTVDSLIELLEVAAAPVLDVYHQDNLPAGIYLVVQRAAFLPDATRRRIARLIEGVRPGGRHLTVIEALPGAFGFSGATGSGGYGVGPLSRLIRP